MKKILAVLVSVMLCICLMAPVASAAEVDLASLVEKLEGFDVESLTSDDIATILGVDDLSTINSVIGTIKGDTPVAAAESDNSIDGVLSELESLDDETIMKTISDALGFDVGALAEAVEGDDAFSSILGMLGGSEGDASGLDVSALTDMISGAFGDSGLDLGALTEGVDVGDFDIASVISGDTSGGTMDIMATIMEALTSGLAALGLDTSMLSGIADTDIVNFIANLFIGLGGETTGTSGGDTVVVTPTEATTAQTNLKTPNTGDTSAVFVAMGTLAAASAAAFVCLKSKKKVEE